MINQNTKIQELERKNNELINKLLLLEKEKLINDYNHFDTEFSSPYFTFTENNTVANFKNASNSIIYSDYHLYPVSRIKYLFKSKFTVDILFSGYGWYGIGSNEIKNDGFPGYTNDGYMICNDSGKWWMLIKILFSFWFGWP